MLEWYGKCKVIKNKRQPKTKKKVIKKTHYNVDQCGGGEIKHSKIGNMPKAT